jgi:two-component system invasion response regulator UvrY
MTRVLLVDDHVLVRTGIRQLLELEKGIQVVGEASSGEEALARLADLRPEVVVMDVSMPGMGGLEATVKLLRRDPGLRIVVVTVHRAGPYPRRFLQAGARGYLHKGCSPEELRRAIELAARGQIYLSQEVAQHLALARGGPADAFMDLTRQEFEVLLRTAAGDLTDEIAAALHMSPKTVATYRSRIYQKLGVRDAVALAHLALSHDLIPVRAGQGREAAGSGQPAGAGARAGGRRTRYTPVPEPFAAVAPVDEDRSREPLPSEV